MNDPARILHLAYRTGAVVDGAMLVPLLVPSAGGAMLGLDRFSPGPEYRYVATMCAALMAGWTVLLLRADRDPVGRRGVLVLTVFPVLVGLMVAGGYAIGSGLVRPAFLVPVFAMQLLVTWLFVRAYRRAGNLAPAAASGHHAHPGGKPDQVRLDGGADGGHADL